MNDKTLWDRKVSGVGAGTYGHESIEIESWEHIGAVEPSKLHIGKYCAIAAKVRVCLGGNHRIDWFTTYPFPSLPEYPEVAHLKDKSVRTKGDVVIGNAVWICNGVKIMSGVKIGDGAVIGAESVLARNVEPYSLYVGNPAQFVKFLFSREAISLMLEMRWWDWPENVLRRALPLLCVEYDDESVNALWSFYLKEVHRDV